MTGQAKYDIYQLFLLFSLNKGGNSTQATTWASLEDIVQSEIGPSRKRQMPYDSTYMGSVSITFIETGSGPVGGRGGENEELLFNEHRVSVWGDEEGHSSASV